MASKYVDYKGGQNKRLPDWASNLVSKSGNQSFEGVAAALASLALAPVLSPMALAGELGGAWGKTPRTTTPTWQGKEIADADAKRMALKLMLQRQAELSGPPPTTPRAPGVGPRPTTPRAPGYVRPVRPSDQKPRAQGM